MFSLKGKTTTTIFYKISSGPLSTPARIAYEAAVTAYHITPAFPESKSEPISISLSRVRHDKPRLSLGVFERFCACLSRPQIYPRRKVGSFSACILPELLIWLTISFSQSFPLCHHPFPPIFILDNEDHEGCRRTRAYEVNVIFVVIRTTDHGTAPCPAKGCSNKWKRCQITGGCFRLSNNWTYRMCYGCKDHPAVKGDLDFGGKQRDVTRKQKQDYQDTAMAGGDTSSGEIAGSSPWHRILLPSIWRMSYLNPKWYFFWQCCSM